MDLLEVKIHADSAIVADGQRPKLHFIDEIVDERTIVPTIYGMRPLSALVWHTEWVVVALVSGSLCRAHGRELVPIFIIPNLAYFISKR
jgi:hypothetical protein